jgi:periplasmic divalent cation tolerance protein
VTACYQVSTTLGSEAEASRLASALVEERLAACAQVIGPVRSVYHWKGDVTQATEWLCTAKTIEARLSALLQRIRALHSYELPEILATPIVAGDPGYLDWLRQEATPSPESS